MRVIAGEWRGRPLLAPDGQTTRPTSDRAREGLFSMLTSRLGSFEDLRVADLFAGSGALGIEALSRGARHCLFVDGDSKAVRAIKTNLDALDASDRAEVRAQLVRNLREPGEAFDLVMLDPPYGADFAQAALDHICNSAWVVFGGIVSIETDGSALNIPEGFAKEAERRFGMAHLLLLRRTLS